MCVTDLNLRPSDIGTDVSGTHTYHRV